MSEQLKPCPFCGGEAHERMAFPIDEDGLEMNMYIVGCRRCDIEFSWLWDKEYAIELWNTRKPIDDIVAKLEEESDFFGGEPMGSLQKMYYCKGIEKAIDIVKRGGVE